MYASVTLLCGMPLLEKYLMDSYEILYNDSVYLKDDARHFRFLTISIMSPWRPIFVFYDPFLCGTPLLKKYSMDYYEIFYDDYICLKDDARYFRFLKISIMPPWQHIFCLNGH